MWHGSPVGRPYEQKRASSPERRLLIAVLWNAITEYQDLVCSRRGAEDVEGQRLRKWFFEHDEKWPFSFENVCEQLEIDPDSIRARLGVLTDEPSTGSPHGRRRGR